MKTLRSREHRALIRELKHARDEAGLTQTALARRLGQHQSFVAKFETGERRLDVVQFLRITEALRTDPCALLKRIR